MKARMGQDGEQEGEADSREVSSCPSLALVMFLSKIPAGRDTPLCLQGQAHSGVAPSELPWRGSLASR